MLHDDQHLDGVPSFTGISCDAGHRFVNIMPNGDVLRCGSGDRFGNILAHTFTPRRRPTPCNTEHCYYWCKKYSLPDRTQPERAMDYLSEQMRRIAARGGAARP
jgi:hypothetical protein